MVKPGEELVKALPQGLAVRSDALLCPRDSGDFLSEGLCPGIAGDSDGATGPGALGPSQLACLSATPMPTSM